MKFLTKENWKFGLNSGEREGITMYCKNCGQEIDDNAEICPKCGVRVKSIPIVSEKKSSGIAAIASFIIPGLGQVYNGEIGKGIIFMIIAFVFALSMMVVIGFILYPLFWIYNIYDAYKTAEKINREEVCLTKYQ